MRGGSFGPTVGPVDLGEEEDQESNGFTWR
jgi:hypothetical protein